MVQLQDMAGQTNDTSSDEVHDNSEEASKSHSSCGKNLSAELLL